MYLVRFLLAAALLFPTAAKAQTSGGFADGAPICANLPNVNCPGQLTSLNGAFAKKADYPASGAQLLGTTTNDNAAAGNVGEFLSATVLVGAPVALTSGLPSNLVSLPLTAGDWDVWCQPNFTGSASTVVSYTAGSIGTASATFTQVNGAFMINPQYGTAMLSFVSPVTGGLVGPTRVSVASTTTEFCVVQASFITSTLSTFGSMFARRVR